MQQNCGLMTAEELEFRSEDLITEKGSSQSPGSRSISEVSSLKPDIHMQIRILS